jgi:hypothetical protein
MDDTDGASEAASYATSKSGVKKDNSLSMTARRARQGNSIALPDHAKLGIRRVVIAGGSVGRGRCRWHGAIN